MEGALSKTLTSPRASREHGYCFMGPESMPRTLRQIVGRASFVLAVSEGKVSKTTDERLLRQAVERNLEIIGEAMGRISGMTSETAAA